MVGCIIRVTGGEGRIGDAVGLVEAGLVGVIEVVGVLEVVGIVEVVGAVPKER